MDAKFRWNKPLKVIAKEKTGGRKGMQFLAEKAKDFMDPYVPAKNLILSQNVRITADEDCGHVTYNSPYAHYQFEGILYVDPLTKKGAFTDGEGRFWSRPGVAKVPSDRKLEYSAFRHPLATDHWDKAMRVSRGEDLAKAYENYLKGRG